jgi:hypothetical protein
VVSRNNEFGLADQRNLHSPQGDKNNGIEPPISVVAGTTFGAWQAN